MATKYKIQVRGGEHVVLTVDDSDLNTVLGVRSFVTRKAFAVEVGGAIDIQDQATTNKIFIGIAYDDILKADNSPWGVTIGATVAALNAFFETTPHELEDLDDVPNPVDADSVLTFDGTDYVWATGGAGSTILSDLPWDLGNLSFGRLTGSGTFTVPPGGITVADFITNVLVTQSLEITATPSSFAFNEASILAQVTPTFGAGWTTSSVTRILNGAETVIEASPTTGLAIADTVTFSPVTAYALSYRLNVSDVYGTADSVIVSIPQTPYAAPTVTAFVPGRTAGTSNADNETNYFREIGNFQSSVSFTANRNSPLVDMNSVRLDRGASTLDTQVPTNPSYNYIYSDNTAPTNGSSYSYTVLISDDKQTTTIPQGTISFNKPVLFTTDTGAYTSSSTNADLQNVIDNYAVSAGYYRLRDSEASFTFSAKAAMNDNTKYTYIMYDSSLGALTALKQGGNAGTDIVFNDLGTFTVTNQFSETLTMRVYRSPFTQAFAENVQVYIEF